MQAIVTLLMVPLILLNVLGGIVSGIWLGILGEWWAIGYGLAGLFLSHFLLAFALMPGMLVLGPAMFFLNRGNTFLAAPFVFLGNLYTSALMAGWCLVVFYFFSSRADFDSYIPLLIWSYGVALGPWVYMAQKERQSGTEGGESISIFFAQVAYIVIALMAVFSRSSLLDLAVVFVCIMAVGMLIQFGIAFAMLREQKKMGLI